MPEYARFNLVVTDESGNIVDGASISVQNEVTLGFPQLYSTRTGTTSLGNPFTAADGADAGFHVTGGAYKIVATLGAFSRTWRYVGIGTASEIDLDETGILQGARDYYVRTDGSDSNDGLTNTSGGAFLTIQKAINESHLLQLNSFNVTINVADGAYNAVVLINNPWNGQGGLVTIVGNTGDPSLVTISTSGDCISCFNGGRIYVSGLTVASSAGSGLVAAGTGSIIAISGNFRFGACAVASMNSNWGGRIHPQANYSLVGGGQYHILCDTSGLNVYSDSTITVTISGNPTFSVAFAAAFNLGNLRAVGVTYSVTGTVTGTRYLVTANSVIQTNSGGASYFPGTVAGSAASGGQYL